jgi:hypothetical protein
MFSMSFFKQTHTNTVFLNPNLKIGNPDALTPDPSLKVPTTRAAKTENYRQNMKTAAQREKRSKMTKKEREEEQSRAEKVFAISFSFLFFQL